MKSEDARGIKEEAKRRIKEDIIEQEVRKEVYKLKYEKPKPLLHRIFPWRITIRRR